MRKPDDFYGFFSEILKEVTHTPGIFPIITSNQWPARSKESRLLANFQSAISALRSHYQTLNEDQENKKILIESAFQTCCDGIIIIDLDSNSILEVNPAACAMHGYSHEEFIGLPISSFVHPDFQPIYRKDNASLLAGELFHSQTTHLHRNGSSLHFNCGLGIFRLSRNNYLLVTLRERRESSERAFNDQLLQKRVESRIHEQTTLLEISQTLSSTLDLDPELILEQLRKIISYSYAALFTIHDSSLMVLAICGIEMSQLPTPIQIKIGGSGTPRIFFNGQQTTRIANIWGEEPEAIFLRSLFNDYSSIFLEGIKSWMWVPLIVKGRMLGGLGIAHEQVGYFSVHHSDLAQTVANQAAITMVNAELYEHAQMYASLQERQRLARNLHDAVNQSLFTANLIAEVLPKQYEKDPYEGKRSLEKLKRLTNGAMAEMRMMMAELRPLSLIDDDLGNLMHLLADAFTGRSNIPVSINIVGKNRLPTDVQIALYRLCQEGLNNIAKHACATKVEISVFSQNNQTRLVISDNGCGFDPANLSPGHYGLRIMEERAESIGAELIINSEKGKGTTLEVIWDENSGRRLE